MDGHIAETPVASDQHKIHSNFLNWINRLMGTVLMFIACLAVCHFAGLIHLNLSHF